MNVRRLAAIDMYGSRGTTRRRALIVAEFLVGVVGMLGFGVWVLIHASDLGGRTLALWLIGAGLNYLPLAMYALMLSRSGALEAELAGVDTGAQLRRQAIFQLWILVPLSLVVFAGFDAFGGRARR
jgi:hypothetical protein